MHVLLRLVLRRLSKGRVITGAASLLLPAITWFFRGLLESFIFDSVLRAISNQFFGGRTMWINDHPEVVLVSIPVLVLSIIFVSAYLEARKEFHSDRVVVTLTEMHRRMFDFANKRVSHNRNPKWLAKAVPFLCDKWGLVDIGDYDKWASRMRSRVRRAFPTGQSPQIHKVASMAGKIKRELMESRGWTEADLVKVGEWLDEQGKGVGAIRDSDVWARLNDALINYRVDKKLKALIEKYQGLSYIYCSIFITEQILTRERGEPVANILLSVLMGMPLNKGTIKKGLDDVLDEARARMRVLQRQREKQLQKARGVIS
jgi:hypothetical protein